MLLLKPGLAASKTTAITGPVKVGDLKSFTKEGLDDRFLKDGFFLVRSKDRIYALSAFCTHQTDSRLSSKAGAEVIICPNHNSLFALDGTVIRGPARRDLSRFAITADAKGQLTVDTSKPIGPDKIDDEPAFVKVG